ncbi:MAG: hypothetical protein FWE37_06550 [Spirochaetaceae bacterium]|nr:hypothetical protein [Spirochaetaceae bacterium]
MSSRIAKPSNPEKIAELKQKINSATYLDTAVAGIATTLAHGFLQWNGINMEEDVSKKRKQ